MLSRIVTATLALSLMLPAGVMAAGADYPTKPVRILASEPGAQVDLAARLIAQGLTPILGQQVIVDNRPGIVSVETAARATPDAYTLLFYTSAVWVLPLLQKVSFDPIRDFSPVTIATNAPLFLFVHPAVPAKSARELIALAKAKPGELNYGSAPSGTTNHLAAELFKSMAGVDIVSVRYKGTAPAALGVVTNQVQMMFASGPVGMPQVKSGRLRVLGVASAQPSALAPEVPTIAATGLPGYEAASLGCIWVPAGTPAALISRLSREIVRLLGKPEAQERFLAAGIEKIGSTPQEAAAYIKSDMAKWDKLIRDAGIRQN